MSELAISERAETGMITIRADLKDKAICDALHEALGLEVPQMRAITSAGAARLLWMSPDELLLVLPRLQVGEALLRLGTSLRGLHHLATDVSEARAVFDISGPGARDLIAKGAPVDMALDEFVPGMIRRTRLGQAAMLFWIDESGTITLMCFRSVSAFVKDWLETVSRRGEEVGFF